MQVSGLIEGTTCTAGYITTDAFREFSTEMDRKLSEMLDRFERMAIPRRNAGAIMYNNLNLVEDFGGKNPVKWALKVVDHLFTKDELRQGVLESSKKTKRTCLSPNRVKLMKDAMNAKFEFLGKI